jgi:hypothetical protein
MNFVIVGTNFISDTLLAAANTLNDFNLYGVCSRAVSSGEAFLANTHKMHKQKFSPQSSKFAKIKMSMLST